MSDTPRCDSEEVGFDDETVFHLGRTVWYVPAGFSRQLERELNETERLLKMERNNGKFPGAEAIETYRGEIRRLERELQDMKLYASYLEDNMSPEALRFAQAGFDIEKSRIPIAG